MTKLVEVLCMDRCEVVSIKWINAQVPLSEEILSELLEKTGKSTIKDALAEAVCHYLCCPHAKRSINFNYRKSRSLRGRKPLYLREYLD